MVGLLFGFYVYFGESFLRKELQWPTLRGRLEGGIEAEATATATTAKANQAAAIAASQAAAVIPFAASQAAAVKEAEIAPTLKLLESKNDLEAALAERRATIEAAGKAKAAEGVIYANCLNAQREAAAAAFKEASERKGGLSGPTLSAMTGAAELAEMQFERLCEQYKPSREALKEEAEAKAKPQPKSSEN